VQGVPPELWHWDGQYFFDKALGVGGVNVQNFRVGGQPASPSDYGEVPPEFEPYMDQSGGGTYLLGSVEADPACAARVDTPEEQAQIYAAGPPPKPPTGEPPGETPEVIVTKPPPPKKVCRRGKPKAKKAASSMKRRGNCRKRKRR
jgi:hypothetical protein